MSDNKPRYPFSDRPQDGELAEVADGVFWVRMPIPIPGLEYINLWLLKDQDGWTMVDTGLNTESIKDIWQTIFARYLDNKPVVRVICTHFHPDHMGLAGWLLERWPGIRLWSTYSEWAFGRMLWLDRSQEIPEEMLDFYRRLAWSETQIEDSFIRRYYWYSNAVYQLPHGICRIQDGDTIRIGNYDWQVIIGRGHSPEHACLHNTQLGVMISGDQVLPRITPHIGVYPSEPDGNPLGDYLSSLIKLQQVPDSTLILPSHNDPFFGLQARLRALDDHHQVRLQRLYDACTTTMTASELIPAMFTRKLRDSDLSLATSEGLAHLHCLLTGKRLQRSLSSDGVYLFSRAEQAQAA